MNLFLSLSLFLTQAPTEAVETELPWWITIIVALAAAIGAFAKKYKSLKGEKVPAGANVFDTLVYLIGQDPALFLIDEEVIRELNSTAESLTFEEYVSQVKKLAIEKTYVYITKLPQVKAVAESTDDILDTVKDLIMNMIDSKYDEEDFRGLYELFLKATGKAVEEEVDDTGDTVIENSGDDTPDAEEPTKTFATWYPETETTVETKDDETP